VRPAANFLVSDSDYVEVLTEIDIQTPIPRGRATLAQRPRLRLSRLPIFDAARAHFRAPDHQALLGSALRRAARRADAQ
jgi:hypothetical protein